jgi:hypothetical protein
MLIVACSSWGNGLTLLGLASEFALAMHAIGPKRSMYTSVNNIDMLYLSCITNMLDTACEAGNTRSSESPLQLHLGRCLD